MFTVRISFDADEGRDVVRRLVDALGEHGPRLAHATVVSYDAGYVTMEFAPVPGDATRGPTSVEGATPGAESVAVRTLLTASAARTRPACRRVAR